MRKRPFKIAEFRIDPARNVISGPSGESATEPKIMEVLCALAERPGHVFSRSELVDLVWGHAFGADESLTRAISQLRKLFGDSRDEARILETIQKRGYRLIAPVSDDMAEPADSAGSGPRSGTPSVPARPRWWLAAAAGIALALTGLVMWRVAVVPGPAPAGPASVQIILPDGIAVSLAQFAYERDQPDMASLAQAVKAGLITNMSRISLLHLDAGASAEKDRFLRYRVEGSVQRAGTRMRVNIQLISVADGEHVWAANFDRPYDARRPMQDEFTSAITHELISQILNTAKADLKKRPLESLAPWALTLLGTGIPGSDEVFLTPHTRDAFWLQRRALTLDPSYAPAHASLASSLAYHALFNPEENNKTALAQAERHAQIALAKAPYAPEVLYQVASYYRFRGERRKSTEIFRRILEIHPDDIQAGVDLPFIEGQCSRDSAAALARLQAIEQGLSPANPMRRVVLSHLADIYLSQGQFVLARDAALQSRNIVQNAWSGITLAAALAQLGQTEEALRISAETKREWPNLDYDYFADHIVPLWCFGGPDAGPARRAFQTLGRAERQRK